MPQQIHAGRVVHPFINVRRREKAPTNFESMQSRNQTTGSLNAETQRTPRSAEENKLCETLRSPRLCVENLRKKTKVSQTVVPMNTDSFQRNDATKSFWTAAGSGAPRRFGNAVPSRKAVSPLRSSLRCASPRQAATAVQNPQIPAAARMGYHSACSRVEE